MLTTGWEASSNSLDHLQLSLLQEQELEMLLEEQRADLHLSTRQESLSSLEVSLQLPFKGQRKGWPNKHTKLRKHPFQGTR